MTADYGSGLTDGDREAIRGAILACDQDHLSEIAFMLGLAGIKEQELMRETTALVATAPYEVQVFWLGECNCDGHLN